MSAAIVYQGVISQYEGTLFNGLKFFIHSTVPLRKEVEEKVKTNGGKVVQLEGKADIKIGDPVLPKRAPEGSVSYKFIDHCIEKGTVCDIDRFQILAPRASRPGVSSTGARTTRKGFTPQEDSILVKWVVQQKDLGQASKGQRIYEKLVDKLVSEGSVHKNAHTAQSWRDRWVKRFEGRPLSDLQSYLNTPDSPAPPTQSAPLQPAHPQPAPRELDVPQPTSSVLLTQRQQAPSKKRAKFTQAEDEMLLEYVADRVRSGEKALGHKIYQELCSYGEEYQTHTAQSWLARYKLLTERPPVAGPASSAPIPNPARNGPPIPPRDTAGLTGPGSARRESGTIASPIRFSVHSISEDHLDIRELSQQRSGPPTVRAKSPSGSDILRLGDMTTAERIQVTKTVKGLQAIWRGYRVRRDLEPEVNIEQDDMVQLPDPDSEDERAKARRAKAENDFYNKLKAYHNHLKSNPYKTVDITAQGAKMVLPLWELWRAVTRREPDHSLRDWKGVAQSFNIDSPGVADQLKSAFEEHLLEFEKLLGDHLADPADDSELESDDTSSDDEEEEEEEEEEEHAQSNGFNPGPQLPELPSLPPSVIGVKRAISWVETSSDADIDDPTPKRPRYNSTDEIPCSPELSRQPPLITAEPEGLPQLLPLLPKETPERATTVLPSIETDQPDLSPTQQLLSENDMGRHGHVVSESTASDLESDAFDPPVHPLPPSRPVSERVPAVAQEPRRRTLPKSWTKPDERSPTENSKRYDQQPSPKSMNSVTHRPRPPLPKQTPPSRPVSATHRARPSTNPPAGQSALRPTSASVHNPAASSSISKKPDQALIDEFIHRGYDKDDVIDVLEATTNDVGLAGQVLKDGKGIPTNIAGVWTSRDDKALRSCHEVASRKVMGDPEKAREAVLERERLIKKHTEKKCRERAKYLGYLPWM